jgi:hypothetical protein
MAIYNTMIDKSLQNGIAMTFRPLIENYAEDTPIIVGKADKYLLSQYNAYTR